MEYNQQFRKELHSLKAMVRTTFGYQKYLFIISPATQGIDCYNNEGLYLKTYETCQEAVRLLIGPRHLRDNKKPQVRLIKNDRGSLKSHLSQRKVNKKKEDKLNG